MEKERAKEMISRYRDKIFGFSLEKGMLEPLTDIQKKSVFSVFIYN